MKRIVIVLFAAFALAGCGQAGLKPGKRQETVKQPVAVKVMEVGMTGNSSSRTYVGTVHPAKSSVVSCIYPGTLTELKVVRGQYVRKGDVIAVIESQSVKSSLDMAAATLQQARDGYRRAKSVHESGSMADVKMVEVESKLKQAEAAYEAAEKAYADCVVKAPYPGVVGDVYTETGVELSIAEPIMKIMDISSLEIHIPVPEGEVNSVNSGVRAYVSVPALDMDNIPASLLSKGITASPLSHSYECRFVPDGRVEGLMPGMVCKVVLSWDGNLSAVVPADIVRTDVSGRYVWTVKDGTVVKAPVVTGGFSGDGIIVKEGLDDGDLVIVDGVKKVSSGMKVKITE